MGILLGLLTFGVLVAVVAKCIEVISQGAGYNIPPLRLLNTRWGVTTRSSGYSWHPGTYVFRGSYFAPSVIMKVDVNCDSLEAAKLVAKYANDHGLRGLPDLNRSRTLSSPETVLDFVKSWHESGGGKGGRVIEV